MDGSTGKNKTQIQWPRTESVPYKTLAQKISEFCQELNRREVESRERSLEAAREIWPHLKAAIHSAGKKVGLNDLAKPVMPEWAKEPVVALAGHYGPEPRNKQEALKIALTVGDGGWATIDELWLWVSGGGPIVNRTLQKYGYKP